MLNQSTSHFDGKQSVSSLPGFIMTIVVVVIIGAFAVRKAEMFLLREKPFITETNFVDYFDDKKTVNFN